MNLRRITILLAVAAIAAAFAFAPWWRDAEPDPTTRQVAAPAGAATPAAGSVGTASTDASSVAREPEAAANPPEPAPDTSANQLRVELRDSADRPVAGARVIVWKEDEVVRIGVASADGGLAIAPPQDTGDLAAWIVVAALPGRVVSRPFLPFTRPSLVTVAVGDVGTLRVTCRGATDTIHLDLLAEVGGEMMGGRGNAEASGEEPVDIAVPAGNLDFRILATNGERSSEARAAGPRGQGDVVEVSLDFTSCRVTGTFAADDPGGQRIYAVAVERDAVRQFAVAVGSDRAFAVDLPRMREATVAIVRGAECALVPQTNFDTPAEHAGIVELKERPRLGFVEVRDTDGVVSLDSPAIGVVTTAYGTVVPRAAGAAVYFRATLDKGVDVFSVPGIVAVEVAPSRHDSFCVPESLTVRDGLALRASFLPGATVVVRDTDARTGQVRFVSLVAVGNARTFSSESVQQREGAYRYTFRGLPPGEYRVEATDANVIGGTIQALAGSRQEVDVTFVP